MKFVCFNCCDEINVEPCCLTIPNDYHHSAKDIMAGLTQCPFEGCNYNKGVWVKNGETYKAKWERVK